MNFLAHIYLSGNHELITIGNFVADAIRGKSYQDIAEEKALTIGKVRSYIQNGRRNLKICIERAEEALKREE